MRQGLRPGPFPTVLCDWNKGASKQKRFSLKDLRTPRDICEGLEFNRQEFQWKLKIMINQGFQTSASDQGSWKCVNGNLLYIKWLINME